MFNYNKHPLNVWVYGLSMLFLLLLPLVIFVTFLYFYDSGEVLVSSGNILDDYFSVMLFPYEFSSKFLFQVPYFGIILTIVSYVIHIHFYSMIIERVSILFRGNSFSRTTNSQSDGDD